MQPVEGICSWVNAALLAAQWHRELQILLAYYFTFKLVAERYQTKLTSSKRRQLVLFWTPTAVTQVICEDQKTATAAVELCRQKKPCRHLRLQHLVMLQGRQGGRLISTCLARRRTVVALPPGMRMATSEARPGRRLVPCLQVKRDPSRCEAALLGQNLDEFWPQPGPEEFKGSKGSWQ